MSTEASVGATLRASSTALRNAGGDADEGELVAVAVLLLQLETELAGFARDHDGVRRAADQDLQVRGRERLGQVVPGPDPQRLDAARDARIAGHHHDDGILALGEDALEDVETAHLRHVQVDQHDVELPPPHRLQRLLAAADRRDVVPVGLQHRGAALAQRALVVDDEDADAGLHLGGDGQRVAGRFGHLHEACQRLLRGVLRLQGLRVLVSGHTSRPCCVRQAGLRDIPAPCDRQATCRCDCATLTGRARSA